MFGGDPTTTVTTTLATMCNSVPVTCVNEIDLTTAGISEDCFLAAAPFAVPLAECLTCDPPMLSAATVCPACKKASRQSYSFIPVTSI